VKRVAAHDKVDTHQLSSPLALAITAAKAKLTGEMRRMGLFPKDGWSIDENRASARHGAIVEVVLQPRHPTLAPPDLKQIVRSGRL
jgi:hypothetical protein